MADRTKIELLDLDTPLVINPRTDAYLPPALAHLVFECVELLQEIGWAGDIQPVGYTAAQVAADDGPDPVAGNDLPAVQELIDALPLLARARSARSVRRG